MGSYPNMHTLFFAYHVDGLSFLPFNSQYEASYLSDNGILHIFSTPKTQGTSKHKLWIPTEGGFD
jgi:hypothetical protein